MANQNDNQEVKRVFSRTGARELTPKELEHVSGGIHTNTVCTFDVKTNQGDGDVGEC